MEGKDTLKRFLLRLIINAAAIYVAVELVNGLSYRGEWWGFLIIAFFFGLVNAVIRPIVALLTCPLIILTLGLFTLVINAFMLWLASWLSTQSGIGFSIDGFWPALLGALIISIVSFVLTSLLSDDERQGTTRHRRKW